MKNKILALLITTLSLFGCAGVESSSSYENSSYGSEAMIDYDEDVIGGEIGTDYSKTKISMIVKNGYINIKSDNYEVFYEELTDIVELNGGHFVMKSLSRGDETFADFTIKVPSEKFEVTFNSIEKIGKVNDSSIEQQDISESYISTTSYLELKKIEEERLLAIREKATKIEDIIAIEEQLAEVRTQISIKSELANSMENQTKYSEIYIHYSDKTKLAINPLDEDFLPKLFDAFITSLLSLQYILVFIAYAILPVTLIIIFWFIYKFIFKKLK